MTISHFHYNPAKVVIPAGSLNARQINTISQSGTKEKSERFQCSAFSSVSPFPGNQGDLPVGGTTGLCHSSSAIVDVAADWFRNHRQACPHPVIPALQARFGLSAVEAVTAIRLATR